VRALNVIGTIALVVLAFYLGWVLMGSVDDRQTKATVGTTPSR
jgi:hypothetical protein